eukprot:2890089-Rhodomonas_salina.1
MDRQTPFGVDGIGPEGPFNHEQGRDELGVSPGGQGNAPSATVFPGAGSNSAGADGRGMSVGQEKDPQHSDLRADQSQALGGGGASAVGLLTTEERRQLPDFGNLAGNRSGNAFAM